MGLFNINNNSKVQSSAFSAMLYVLLDHSVSEISVKTLTNSKNEFIVLDAREKNEFEVSHIKNARFVGYKNFDISSISDIKKQEKIVVYCSLGKRSENIVKKLKEAGYSNVFNLYGGIFEWKNQNYPVYINDSTTNKVHAYDKVFGVWLNKGEKVFD